MADLKNIDADTLTARVREEAERAVESIRRVANEACIEARQAARALAELPLRTDLLTCADIAHVSELDIGGNCRWVTTKIVTSNRGEYMVGETRSPTHDAPPVLPAGRYRVLVLVMRIGDGA